MKSLLRSPGWSPAHLVVLHRLLEQIPHLASRPCAVFDWDFTCAFQDTQDHVFRHLILRGQSRVTIDDLTQSILPIELWTRIQSELPFTHDEWISEFTRAQSTGHHDLFFQKLAQVYLTLCQRKGLAWAYRWSLSWFMRLSPSRIRDLSLEVIRRELAQPLSSVGGLESEHGGKFPTGLRIQTEVRELISALRTAGCEVWVVTASLTEVITPFACEAEFGFGFSPAQILGNTALKDIQDHGLGTWGPGKTATIRAHLPASPILIAGDSDGDYDMLTAFSEMKLGLVLERETPNRLGTLQGSRYLFQRRDQKTGNFVPG